MIVNFKNFVAKKDIIGQASKSYVLNWLSEKQKQQFLDALTHKAARRGASVDPDLKTIILNPSLNPDNYLLIYAPKTNTFSLEPRANLFSIPKVEDEDTLYQEAKDSGWMNGYPSFFNAAVTPSLIPHENISRVKGEKSKLEVAKSDSIHGKIINHPKRGRVLLPDFADHPLIKLAGQEKDLHSAIKTFEQVCQEYINAASHMNILECCRNIINHSLVLNDQQRTNKYLDLMHDTMSEFELTELEKQKQKLAGMFLLLRSSIKASKVEVKHEFGNIVAMEAKLLTIRFKLKEAERVGMKLLSKLTNFIKLSNSKIVREQSITISKKNYSYIARLLRIEEYALALALPLTDKLKIANLFDDNKIILNRSDYALLEIAKSLASSNDQHKPKLEQALSRVLSNATQTYNSAAKTNTLTKNDVNLITGLEQLKYSDEYNKSPQFQSVITAINEPGFIHEDPDKNMKELFYNEIVHSLTQLLDALLAQEHMQVFEQKYYYDSCYSIGYMIYNTLTILVEYDYIKKTAREFLTSNKLKDIMSSLSKQHNSPSEVNRIIERLKLYSAQE
jgi:hypothetical protein